MSDKKEPRWHKKSSYVWRIMFFIGIFGILFSIANTIQVYSGVPYEIDIARTHLLLSLDTHGIDERVRYLDETLVMLEPHTGNSEWLFPKERTNIDISKILLADISKDVKDQLDVKEREHYFFIPHNELIIYLDSEINNINQRLLNYNQAYLGSIYHNPLGIIGLSIAVLMIIPTLIYVIKSEDGGW